MDLQVKIKFIGINYLVLIDTFYKKECIMPHIVFNALFSLKTYQEHLAKYRKIYLVGLVCPLVAATTVLITILESEMILSGFLLGIIILILRQLLFPIKIITSFNLSRRMSLYVMVFCRILLQFRLTQFIK